MNAANNLTLVPIGPAVADHDRHAMNKPATKQDLYNMGVQIDSNFGKVISQFTIVDSQFVNLRAEISEQFSKVYVLIEKSKSETRALLSKSTAANTLLFFEPALASRTINKLQFVELFFSPLLT